MADDSTAPGRRPIRARDTRWAGACARALARLGATPNGISVASVACALGAGVAFWATPQASGIPRALLFLAAAAGVQARLLCNLFDGMVAVEGGRRTRSGEIYNELPDRLADWAILLGAGHAAGAGPHGPVLGWAAALLAILTAYVRALGTSAGTRPHFEGPMAKPHRIAAVTVAALASGVAALAGRDVPILFWALVLVAAGSALTAARRTVAIVRELETR